MRSVDEGDQYSMGPSLFIGIRWRKAGCFGKDRWWINGISFWTKNCMKLCQKFIEQEKYTRAITLQLSRYFSSFLISEIHACDRLLCFVVKQMINLCLFIRGHMICDALLGYSSKSETTFCCKACTHIRTGRCMWWPTSNRPAYACERLRK